MYEFITEAEQIEKLKENKQPEVYVKKPEIINRVFNNNGVLLVRSTKCDHLQCFNYYAYVIT